MILLCFSLKVCCCCCYWSCGMFQTSADTFRPLFFFMSSFIARARSWLGFVPKEFRLRQRYIGVILLQVTADLHKTHFLRHSPLFFFASQSGVICFRKVYFPVSLYMTFHIKVLYCTLYDFVCRLTHVLTRDRRGGATVCKLFNCVTHESVFMFVYVS